MDGNASYGSAPVGTGNAKASQLISKQGADRTPWAPSALPLVSVGMKSELQAMAQQIAKPNPSVINSHAMTQ